MRATTIALDLEGTLIQDCLAPIPRPNLYEFLEFCAGTFARVVIFTTVAEPQFRQLAKLLVGQGVTPQWFADIEYVRWRRPYKDLRFVCDDPEQVVIVDDYEGYIHPDQKSQWIQVESFFEQGENDRELKRLMSSVFSNTAGCTHTPSQRNPGP